MKRCVSKSGLGVFPCALFIIACLAAPLNAHAWFFFVIPGAAIDAIADAISGSEGENCVGSNVKVGDKITLSGGGGGVVKSLSGTSYRCTNPALPIRAMVVVRSAEDPSPPESPKATNTPSRVGLRLPKGWESYPPSEPEAARGIVLNAIDRTTQTRVTLYSEKRQGAGDMVKYSEAKRATQAAALKNPQSSAIAPIEINSFQAWRYEVSGTAYDDERYTYHNTIIDTGSEIVRVSAMSKESEYSAQRSSMESLAYGLAGFQHTTSPSNSVRSSESPSASSLPPTAASDSGGAVASGATAPQGPANSRTGSAAQRLRELSSLFKEGLITEKEYDEKKKKLLEEL